MPKEEGKDDKGGKGDKPKEDKGDKGDKKDKKPAKSDKWPKWSFRKVKCTTLEAALASCMKLEDAKHMSEPTGLNQKSRAAKITFALMVLIQLITIATQAVVVIMFDTAVAAPGLAKLNPGAVGLAITAVSGSLKSNPIGALPPLQASVCNTQFAHPFMGYIMLFIWISMMMKELINNLELMNIIAALPNEEAKNDEFKPEKRKDEVKAQNPGPESVGKRPDKLNHMHFPWKLFALLFILIPHLLVAIYTLQVGIRFLVATGMPSKIIMKALALKYILMFDKLFYNAFASEQFDLWFKKAKYVYAREARRMYFHTWITTILRFGFAAIVTLLVWNDYNHILKLRSWCMHYFNVNPPACLGTTCGITFGGGFSIMQR